MDENPYKAPRDYRFSLRSLMIVLAVAPPLLWGAWLGLCLLVASKPQMTGEGVVVLLAWLFGIAVVMLPPVRRAIRRLNER